MPRSSARLRQGVPGVGVEGRIRGWWEAGPAGFQFGQDFVDEAADSLVLAGDAPQDKIADVLLRPGHYAKIVAGIRADFRRRHTPEARLRRLIEIVQE